MNTISLVRPAAGQQVTVPSVKDSTFVVDFSANQITLEKADNALVFRFEDGGSINVADFYTEYNKDNAPDFEVDGQLVKGADFFQAFGPDLAPAEGPSTTERSSRYNEFSGSELADGVDHLDGVAYETGTGSAFSNPGAQNSLLAAALRQAPDSSGNGGGNGGENGGDSPQPPVQYALKYSNVALLGADGQDDPEVHIDLARLTGGDVAGKTLAITNFDGSISYNGTVNPNGTWTFDLDGYQAVYDPVKGELVFTLTSVSGGATGPENYTLVFTDANGQQISHGVRVASTTDHNDMTSIAWKTPEGADMQVTDQTWAGEVAHGAHFTNASTADIAAAIKLPHPPAGEGAYDAGSGREMHYQLTETSFTADGGQTRFEIDLKSGTSSLRISNNDNTAVLTGVEHHEPLSGFGDDYYGTGYTGEDTTEYSANVTATVAAQGTTAQNEIRVTGGDLSIQTVSDQPSFSADGAAYVSGAYATGGGSVSLEAQGVSVGAASVAAETAANSVVITGVRADGGVLENSGTPGTPTGSAGFFEGREFDHSEVSLTAATGDVQVSADLTGTAGVNTAVAGVAATDNGHVNITSADGNVDIVVNNRIESGSLDDSSSFFGVFSGVGLGSNDLPGEGGFSTAYQQYQYISALYRQYLADKFEPDQYGYSQDFTSSRGQQTIVDIQAEKDVNVSLNLGVQDGGFEAAGVNAQFGDVNITSRSGDINVDVAMQGKHSSTGSGQEWVSALEISNGTADLKAEQGDVNLSVNANGENIAVVHYNGATAFPAGQFEFIPDAAVKASSSIAGKNITLTGTVGKDGSSAINHIIGINATHTHKKETFVISADERFTLNVTAVDNGGATSAIGIFAGYALYADGYGGYYYNNQPSYALALGAKEAEISARVEAGAFSSTTGSRSVGIEADGHNLIVFSDAEENRENTTSLGYGQSVNNEYAPTGHLTVSAEGAWLNTGILAHNSGGSLYGSSPSVIDIRADSLTVKATGNPEAGSMSSSTGIAAVEQSSVHIVSNGVNIEAADAHHSVGIHADDGNVSISNAVQGGTSDTALRVIISAKVGTDLESMTNGIAIEAINGGHVQIVSRGDSGDYVEINGGIVTDGTGHVTITTGGGDDVVKLNGVVDIGPPNGLNIDGGDGYNLLILSAPDHDTFMQYYKAWFESGAIDNNIHNFNEIILQGVDMGSDAYHLIQNSVGALDIIVRVIDAGTDLVANAYEHDFSAHDSPTGDNDLLFVRFNGAENPDQDGFDQTMHNIGGVGDGYESVLLDFVGSGDESLFAHSNSLDRLFDMKNSAHENTDIFVRTETSDALVDSGWTTGAETKVLNGETYTQYNHESGETMYVQLTIENGV